MPEKIVVDINASKVQARNLLMMIHNAKSYLDEAEYFTITSQFKQAAFLLHQATEQAIRALLAPLTGSTSYGYNLKSL